MELGLRLILITVGILIILGVVWDYQRRRSRERDAERRGWWPRRGTARRESGAEVDEEVAELAGLVEVEDDSFTDMEWVGEVRVVGGERTSRSGSVPDGDDSGAVASPAAESPQPTRPAAAPVSAPEAEPEPRPAPRAVPKQRPQAAAEPPAPKRREPPREAPPAEMPEEVFALHVMAPRDAPFGGPDLLVAFEAAGLRWGEMEIYHHPGRDGSGRLYSLANMVKPGTFDPRHMGDFTSPGLALFMGLPGPAEPMAAFDAMLAGARGLAVRLGGEVRDDRRNVLTQQTIQSYRDRIAEFERTHMMMSSRS
ncbi:cell division protein ZipA [Thioalbus denitrificans]|uniref:Cell division protein ZipA n=1 Tax=Thioalbus denitrificans TaxID=547122 RepID=A0A369CK35_9GAMM|nr:cell division protein ZipA [Thioalbus denitrificans]RCX32204.1 cell division protein ZipA [Thioalbus denitrificans]